MLKAGFEGFGNIVIEPAACSALKSYRRGFPRREQAGVVVGYRSIGGEFVISSVMPPSRKSKGCLFWVKRDRKVAQAFVEEAFARSSGKMNYLGEWHTHPVPTPTPSGQDYRMMNDLLRNSILPVPFLIGIIVGSGGRLSMWCQDERHKSHIWIEGDAEPRDA